MSKKTGSQGAKGLSRRLSFPGDEERLPWLHALLDAFAIIDTGVAVAVRDEEKRRKTALACAKGCDVCCRQKDIPLYPHELVGIYWYASEKLGEPVRGEVYSRLAAHGPAEPCPFLLSGACAIHPVRPFSCRQFNVFGAACAAGEDPYYTRRGDVLTPISSYTDRAFVAVLPLYQGLPARDAARAVQAIRGQIMNLQTYDWRKLAAVLSGAVKPPP